MEEKEMSYKWESKQRRIFLEATAFWGGRLTTNDLIKHFGISRGQASKDFAEYQTDYPGNLIYDKKLKGYKISAEFEAKYITGDSKEFFALANATGQESNAVDSLMDKMPVEIIQPIPRKIEPTVIRALNCAIIDKRSVTIRYQSMSGDNPETRVIVPHTLVFNGFRWHVRAFSPKDQKVPFKDFLISRIMSIEDNGSVFPEAAVEDDQEWNSIIEIRLIANPKLTDFQRQAVEADYQMTDGELICKVRKPLAGYFLKYMRLGGEDEKRAGKKQQVIVANKEILESLQIKD